MPRRPFDEYDARGRPPVQAPPAVGGECGRPACRPAPSSTRPWTSGPTAPPEVGAGRRNHGRVERGGENGYGQPGRRASRTHRIDVLTRSRRLSPSGARGAPSPRQPATGRSIGSDRRPKVCRRTCGRRYRPRRTITMRNPDQHDGSGARRRRAGRSTSTTPRVRTDAVHAPRAAVRVRFCTCPWREALGPPAARGRRRRSTPVRRRIGVRQRFPMRRDRDGFERAAPPCTTGFSLNPTPNTATPMTTKENPSATTAEPPPMPTATPSPSSGAASRRSSSERATNGSRSYSRATNGSSSASSCDGTPMRRPPASSATGGGKRAGPGDEARRPARGVPARLRRGLRALARHLPAVRRYLRPASRR